MHVAREVDTARLLVVGTYRDVEVDRAHPLSAAVAELRRGKSFTRIRLQGLPLEDVHQLLRTASQHQVSASLAELVYRRTDGNPLFVHELLRFALEDGLIERRMVPFGGSGKTRSLDAFPKACVMSSASACRGWVLTPTGRSASPL